MREAAARMKVGKTALYEALAAELPARVEISGEDIVRLPIEAIDQPATPAGHRC